MSEARTLERPADSGPSEHEIGEHGVVTVSTTLDGIVVRGVDGTSARLIGSDSADVFTEAALGRFSIRTAAAPDWPATGGGRSWLGTVLALGFTRASRTIELEVPRGCRVEASTASGNVTIREMDGEMAVNTASGTVRAQDVTGDARIRTASGDVSIASADRLAATIRTVSGDVEVAAGCLDGLDLSTVSGRVDVTGAIEPSVDGRISTASGRVALALSGDVTVAIRTVSGRTGARHPGAAPRESGLGWVLGQGTARVSVSTISGAISLREPGAEPPTRAAAGHASGPATPAQGRPGVTAEPGFPAGDPGAADTAGVPGAENAAAEPGHAAAATGDPGEPTAGEGSPAPAPDEATLDVLRALERGEIDVDEAARRLETGAHGSDSDA
jgi:Toastrack DUF4097